MAPQIPSEWRPDPDRVAETPLGIYLHVPFCMRRCGYCAFSTVAVGDRLDPVDADRFVRAASAELTLAAEVIGPRRPALTSVYLGGGTPTMLPTAHVADLLRTVRTRFEVTADTEVTIESNPDGLEPGQLAGLREAGVTRVSFGMQSVRRRVLELLDRTHDPELALEAVAGAQRAGFDHVSLDLIVGTPGETSDDVDATVRAAISSGVDHVSAYALAIEPGTKLAARVRAGQLAAPSEDAAADRYVRVDRALTDAGFEWYELSNWSRSPAARSQHNLLYWRNHHWWGVGPSAHSHVAERRWWNLDQVGPWSDALDAGRSPVAGEESPSSDQRSIETVMLGIRLAEGLRLADVPDRDGARRVVEEGLAEVVDDALVLTLRGRLLADHVARRLI